MANKLTVLIFFVKVDFLDTSGDDQVEFDFHISIMISINISIYILIYQYISMHIKEINFPSLHFALFSQLGRLHTV